MKESYLHIIQIDNDIFLNIDNNFVRYDEEFYFCDERGIIDYSHTVPLSFILNNWSKVELQYISKDAFDKYWNNYIYNRGKNKKPVYDLHYINQTHLIDFQHKMKFYQIQPFERIKIEFGPIPSINENHQYIIFEE